MLHVINYLHVNRITLSSPPPWSKWSPCKLYGLRRCYEKCVIQSSRSYETTIHFAGKFPLPWPVKPSTLSHAISLSRVDSNKGYGRLLGAHLKRTCKSHQIGKKCTSSIYFIHITIVQLSKVTLWYQNQNKLVRHLINNTSWIHQLTLHWSKPKQAICIKTLEKANKQYKGKIKKKKFKCFATTPLFF